MNSETNSLFFIGVYVFKLMSPCGKKQRLARILTDPGSSIVLSSVLIRLRGSTGLENLILFKKIIKRYIKVGYNLDVMRQSACPVLNPITVCSYGFLLNCTAVGQASDSKTALT